MNKQGTASQSKTEQTEQQDPAQIEPKPSYECRVWRWPARSWRCRAGASRRRPCPRRSRLPFARPVAGRAPHRSPRSGPAAACFPRAAVAPRRGAQHCRPCRAGTAASRGGCAAARGGAAPRDARAAGADGGRRRPRTGRPPPRPRPPRAAAALVAEVLPPPQPLWNGPISAALWNVPVSAGGRRRSCPAAAPGTGRRRRV